MSKLPGFMFYPADWQKDPNLRICSKAAKGMWIDLMCVAFECEERGVFISGDRPWTEEELCGAVTGDIAENLSVLRELLTKGVARKDNRGAIFNARMVRDEQIRKERSKAGSMGGRPTKYKYLNVVSSKSKTKAKVKQITEYVNESENGNGKLLKTKKLNSETVWEESPLFEFEKFMEKLADWPLEKIRHYHNLFCLSDPGKYKYSDWSLAARRWDKKDPWKGKENQTRTLSQIFDGINAK